MTRYVSTQSDQSQSGLDAQHVRNLYAETLRQVRAEIQRILPLAATFQDECLHRLLEVVRKQPTCAIGYRYRRIDPINYAVAIKMQTEMANIIRLVHWMVNWLPHNTAMSTIYGVTAHHNVHYILRKMLIKANLR